MSVLAARIPRSPTPPDVVRYIPCPRCQKLMNRTNFAHSSGVVLDVCKTHGVWLDRGELQRVLGFIESGGLTLARDREREQLADEQRRLAALADRSPQSSPLDLRMTPAGAGGVSTSTTPGSLLESLLFDALGVVFSK